MSVSFFSWITLTTIIVIWFFMIGQTISKSIKEEIRCFICNPALISDNTVLKLYNSFPNYDIKDIPICGTNAALNFTLNCPEVYKGCLTKIDGKNALKSCNKYYINDCKTANNVTYCFCTTELCNNATIPSPNPSPTDDEDLDQSLEEGSGLFDDRIQLDKHKYIDNKINTKVILNDTSIKNNAFSKLSAGQFFLSNILSLVFLTIVYN